MKKSLKEKQNLPGKKQTKKSQWKQDNIRDFFFKSGNQQIKQIFEKTETNMIVFSGQETNEWNRSLKKEHNYICFLVVGKQTKKEHSKRKQARLFFSGRDRIEHSK